jgi:TatA/E family protein of Tat protein translocase
MLLFVFEFLGTTELLVIAFVALIIFGPRKLPELGRSLGKSLGEFKRASEDFKQTWEREVEVERIERELRIDTEIRSNPLMTGSTTIAADSSLIEREITPAANGDATHAQTIARTTTTATTTAATATTATGMTADAPATVASTEPSGVPSSATDATHAPEAPRKQDWL